MGCYYALVDPYGNDHSTYCGPDARDAVGTQAEKITGDGWSIEKRRTGAVLPTETVSTEAV